MNICSNERIRFMKKIAGVVIPYFGKFKPSFKLFIESCQRNLDLDWIIITDNEELQDLPQNVVWKRCTLPDIEKLARERLDKEASLNSAYKLCDYKVTYGELFENFLEDYEYWGYGDVDVIYGDLVKKLKAIDFRQYEKINWMGHFALLKNNDKCKKAWRIQDVNFLDPLEVIRNGKTNYGFDEQDFNKKLVSKGYIIFDGIFAADIDVFYPRMRCVEKSTVRWLCNIKKQWKEYPTNYSKQVFVCVDGRIYRYYIKKGKMYKQEFAYIHFRTEPKSIQISSGSFIISRAIFVDIDKSKLNNIQYIRALIDKYNSQDNVFIEVVRFLKGYLIVSKNRVNIWKR